MRFACELDQLPSKITQMQRDNDPVFREQTANLVSQLGAVSHQPTSNSMQNLHVLLRNRLLRNKAHLRPTCRLADPSRILHVILLSANIRLHKLRCDQPDLMTKRSDHSSPVMSPSRRLHRYYAPRSTPKKLAHLFPPESLL